MKQSKERPLSATQKALLHRVHLSETGIVKAPWGGRNAGQRAAAFWRTARALERRGLVWCRMRTGEVSLPHSGPVQTTWKSLAERQRGFGESRMRLVEAEQLYFAGLKARADRENP